MLSETVLAISQRKLVRLAMLITAILAAAHLLLIVSYYGGFLSDDAWIHIAFFDLDEEEAFGTWFSTMLLATASSLLALQAHICRTTSDRWRVWWSALAFGFLLLSIEEVIGVHEYLNTVVESTRWTTFGAGVVLVVALSYLPFLRALPPRSRYLFIAAGALYVGGAIGVERATDWYADHDLLNTMAYNTWTAVEEILEISGVVLFIYALIGHLRGQAGGVAAVRVTFTN